MYPKTYISYEEDDEPLHNESNGYKCGQPGCICEEAEEAELPSISIFLPSTEEALRDLREHRR